MTSRIRALLVFLTVMVVLLSAVVVGQLYMISNLDDRKNELHVELLDLAVSVGKDHGCYEDRLDDLEAGVPPPELEPGEVFCGDEG